MAGEKRIGWLRVSVLYRVRGQGSIPQPHQKLPSIDPAEGGGGPVVGAEVIPESVVLRCLAGGGPADRPVAGVGAGFDQVGEGGVGHGVRCG